MSANPLCIKTCPENHEKKSGTTGQVFVHKWFADRRRLRVSSYAVLIRVYVQICNNYVYQERLGNFESLIIKMRDFNPKEFIYVPFVGQREFLGTDLHRLDKSIYLVH